MTKTRKLSSEDIKKILQRMAEIIYDSGDHQLWDHDGYNGITKMTEYSIHMMLEDAFDTAVDAIDEDSESSRSECQAADLRYREKIGD